MIDRVLKIGIVWYNNQQKIWFHGKLCNMIFQRPEKVQLALNLFFIDARDLGSTMPQKLVYVYPIHH